ncbi:IS1634 family transposase [Leucobacter sp. HY1910]
MGLRVRTVKTVSGATAVQVVEYRDGKRRITEHVGSAHTPAQLAVLHARAAEIVAGEQQAFDLASLDPARPTAPAVVAASRAWALWEVLEQAWYEIGFGEITNDAFRQLVLGRVIEPVSKVDTIRVLTELGLEAPSLRTIWRVLARCVEQDWRDTVQKAAYTFRQQNGGIGLILYDVTTLYFEAEHEDELRKVGYSKERRVDPQVVIGLLVDSEGFPLEIHCFEGSKPETYTLIPVLESFKKRHQVTDMIVAADAGMLSDQNLTALEDAGFGFIVGSRTAKAPKDLAGHFQTNGAVFEPGEIIETTTVMGRGNTHRRRVVYQFSKKRWARDNKTLDLQRERAQKIVEGTSTPKKARFVKQTGQGETRLDDAGVAKARELAGLKGYVTNLSVDVLDGAGVIAAYHDLYQVERSFRMSKTDLRARPMFHHTRDSIEAHLTIVFCALAVARHLQERVGLSVRRIVTALRPLRDVTVMVGGQEIVAVTPAVGDAEIVLEKMATKPH